MLYVTEINERLKTGIDQQKALRHGCSNNIEIVLEMGMRGDYFYVNITF